MVKAVIDTEKRLRAAYQKAWKAAQDSETFKFVAVPHGLRLQVRPTGKASWRLRIMSDGSRNEYGLGPWPVVSLNDATEQAIAYHRMIRSGIDPVAKKKAAKASLVTFEEAARARHAAFAGEYANPKHAAQWLSTLEVYAFPAIGAMPVGQVKAADLYKALAPIWLTKMETARRVRQRMLKVLDYARSQTGWRDAETPARDLGELLPKQDKARKEAYGHHAAIHYDHGPILLKRLADGEQTISKLALQFIAMTSVRSSEGRGATWQEFDIDAKLWTLPAKCHVTGKSRTKNGNPHSVPLSKPVLAIVEGLRPLKDQSPFLFAGPTGKPISEAALRKVLLQSCDGLKVIDGDKPTIHGWRTAFKLWCQEKRPTDSDAVSEASLAHGDPDKTRGAYARAEFWDMRAQQQGAWAEYLTGASGNVVSIVAA